MVSLPQSVFFAWSGVITESVSICAIGGSYVVKNRECVNKIAYLVRRKLPFVPISKYARRIRKHSRASYPILRKYSYTFSILRSFNGRNEAGVRKYVSRRVPETAYGDSHIFRRVIASSALFCHRPVLHHHNLATRWRAVLETKMIRIKRCCRYKPLPLTR